MATLSELLGQRDTLSQQLQNVQTEKNYGGEAGWGSRSDKEVAAEKAPIQAKLDTVNTQINSLMSSSTTAAPTSGSTTATTIAPVSGTAGGTGGGSFGALDGHIKTVKAYPSAMTQAELEALTS